MSESKVVFQRDPFLGKEGEVGISGRQVIISVFEPLVHQSVLSAFKLKFNKKFEATYGRQVGVL